MDLHIRGNLCILLGLANQVNPSFMDQSDTPHCPQQAGVVLDLLGLETSPIEEIRIQSSKVL